MGPRQQQSLEQLHVRGGYPVTNGLLYSKTGSLRSSDIEPLTCGLCSKILRDPVQLISCGCRYCHSCVQEYMATNSSSPQQESFTCPCDGEQFTRSQIRKDKGCLKEIQQLEVECPSLTPCGWRGSLTSMEDHQVLDCPNATVSCKRGCGATILRSQEEEHTLTCSKREETCSYCLTPVANDQLADHHASCPAYPMSCDFCHQDIPHRREFEKHLEEVCTECELTCPMAKALGCSFKGKRSEMALHTMNNHLLNVLEKVSELSLMVVSVKASNEELRKQVKEKDKKIEGLERRVVKLESQVPFEDLVESDGPTGGRRGVVLDSPYRDLGTLSSHDTTNRHMIKKSSTPQGPAGLYECEQRSTATHALKEAVERHDSQIVRLNTSMQSLQQSLTQYSISVDEVRLRQDVQDVKTTHGVFIWKIPDVRRRYRDALDRKTISLYSPPFQTSPHGYRMCIRVYLNGDGSGKGTYISLFFVLMRSEHDDLLTFPFKQSVRFTLINQENRQESISEAFAPDLRSQSFQKPQGEMNVASGFPKFARQTVLQDERFTRGNVIYIKAQVDLAGLALE